MEAQRRREEEERRKQDEIDRKNAVSASYLYQHAALMMPSGNKTLIQRLQYTHVIFTNN